MGFICIIRLRSRPRTREGSMTFKLTAKSKPGLLTTVSTSLSSVDPPYPMAEEVSPRGSPSPSSSFSTLEHQVREELVCNVCLGILREPRMLECEHSFCLECLERMYATKNKLRADPLGDDELECPCCRGVMKLGSGRVGALPASINLRRLSQLLTEEEKEFTLKRKKAMRNKKSRRQKTHVHTCDSHPEKVIECYCHTCRKLLCVKCLDEHHRSHEWDHVEAAVEKHVASLKSSVQPATEVVSKADEMMTEILGRKEELITRCTKTTEAMHKFFDKAKKIISIHEEKLDRTARRYMDVKVSHLDVHYSKLTESKAAASDMIEKIKRVMREYEILGPSQCLPILSDTQTMVEQLQKCREEIGNTGTTLADSQGPETHLVFQHDDHLSRQLKSLGDLHEHTKVGSKVESVRRIIISDKEDDSGYTLVPVKSKDTKALPSKAKPEETTPPVQEGSPQASPRVPVLCINGAVYDALSPASNQQKKSQEPPQTERPTGSSHSTEGKRSSVHETPLPPLPSAEPDDTYIDHEETNPPPQHRQQSADSPIYEEIPAGLPVQNQAHSEVQRRHSSAREYNLPNNREYCVIVTDDDSTPIPKPPRRNAMASPSMRQGTSHHQEVRRRHMSAGEEDPLRESLPLQGMLQPVMIWDKTQLLSSQAQHDTVYPRGVCCMHKTDNIIIADVKSHFLRLVDCNGKLLMTIGCEGKAGGQFKEPIAVAVDSDNNIYTTELENPRVQKFMPNGKFLVRFGQKKVITSQLQQLGSPEGIAVMNNRDAYIYVSDKEKGKIFVYQPNGKHHFTIGKASQFLRHPVGIIFDRRGRLLVADKGEHCIWVLTPAGEILSRIGSEGSQPGQLLHPHGVAAMADGRIVVVECGNNRVSVFSVNGDFQSAFGGYGSGNGQFNHPTNVCVNSKNQIIVTDEMNHRLQVFELV